MALKPPARKNPKQPAFVTRRKILDYLKTSGASAAEEISGELGFTGMAIRQHLYALEEEKLVTFEDHGHGRGRPKRRWKLTPRADRLFPDRHNDLMVDILGNIRSTFGDEGMQALLKSRGQQLTEKYKEAAKDKKTLAAKAKSLAAARTLEGYMAEVERLKDGALLFVENHCPICDAARTCQSLCHNELEIFQKTLGKSVRVERTEHILAGDRRCAYRISPKG